MHIRFSVLHAVPTNELIAQYCTYIAQYCTLCPVLHLVFTIAIGALGLWDAQYPDRVSRNKNLYSIQYTILLNVL